MWKAKNETEYPIKFSYQETLPGARETRGNKAGKIIISKTSFVGDAPRIWNNAPTSVTNAKTL